MQITMNVLSFFYFLIDAPHKLFYKIIVNSKKYSTFSHGSKSDSELTPYSAYVLKVMSDEKKFKKFRRNYLYRAILEHVGYKLGNEYLARLHKETIDAYLDTPILQKLNWIGSPRVYRFAVIGWASPTVLRYLLVQQQLLDLFAKSSFAKVAEIGVGFGGQLGVSSAQIKIKSCSIYDLPHVAELAKRVLVEAGLSRSKIFAKSIDPVAPEGYDLVISNYAFSELPHVTQLEYVNNIFSRTKRGYLTMNSGRSNHSGRSTGKMSLVELLELIPGSEVLEEDPLTGPDNYIIVWGHNISSK